MRTVSGGVAGLTRRAGSTLWLERGFSLPALIALALAGGAVGAVVGALAPAAAWPLRLGVPPMPTPPGGDWNTAWTVAARSPAALQLDSLHALAGLLGGVVLTVAALACVDLAFLTVALGASRRHEIAVHSAFGAGHGALRAGRRMEAMLLGVVALAAAGVLALAGAEALRASWPSAAWPLTARAAGWALLGAALVPALTVLLYPALHWLGAPTWLRLRALALGEHGTSPTGESSLARGLAVGQAAIAMALLVTSGLLIRAGTASWSAQDEAAVPDTLLVSLNLTHVGNARRIALLTALPAKARLALAAQGARGPAASGVVAGVASAGAGLDLGTVDRVEAECQRCRIGLTMMPLLPALAEEQAVGPGFFAALGVALRSGRGVRASDGPDAAPVAWVNETYVRLVLQGSEPLGRHVLVGGPQGRWHTIVGVVADMHRVGPGTATRPVVYLSALQHPPRHLTLAVRGEQPVAHAGAVTGAVATMAGDGAVTGVESLAARLDRLAAPMRWAGAVSAALGALALLMALMGIYTVMAGATARRQQELGLRAAVGATPRKLLGLVMREALGLALIAVAVGAVLALTAARTLQSVSPGVRLVDPGLLAAAALATAVTLLAGAWRPARRAAALTPVEALRQTHR